MNTNMDMAKDMNKEIGKETDAGSVSETDIMDITE
jgi:hypothetical protein